MPETMARSTVIIVFCLLGGVHASSENRRGDLLGRFFHDITAFGGVEARLSASDADVIDLGPAIQNMPTLEVT